MLKFLKKLFGQQQHVDVEKKVEIHPVGTEEDDKNLQIATCALFIEIAKADSHFAKEEKERIVSVMKSTFNLDEESLNELMRLSEQKVDESRNLFEIASVINEHFSEERKFKLLKNLWRLTYADNNLDLTEDYLIRKIGSTLNVDYKMIIQAKEQADNKSFKSTGEFRL